MTADWIPVHQPHKWEKDKAQFATWLDSGQLRLPWKRTRFIRWSREQDLLRIRNARAVEHKLREDRAANPSAELLAAYQELSAVEEAVGGRLGCARGADMTDPQQVRALAQLLSELPNTDRQ